MFRRYSFLKQRAFVLAAFGVQKLLFKLRDRAISKLTRLLKLAAALCDSQSIARFFKLALQIGRKSKFLLFSLPFRCQLSRFLFEIRQLFFKALQTIYRGRIGFNLQRFAFDFKLHRAAVDLVEFFRLESTCIRKRDAASSTRSMALSGKNRSVI